MDGVSVAHEWTVCLMVGWSNTYPVVQKFGNGIGDGAGAGGAGGFGGVGKLVPESYRV